MPVQLLTAGLTLFGVGFQAAQTIATIVVTVGANTLLGTRQKGDQVKAAPAKYNSLFEVEDSSAMIGFGRCRIVGVKNYGNTSGVLRFRQYAHVEKVYGAAIDEIEDYYLGSRNVIVDINNLVGSYPYNRSAVQYVFIKSQIGDGTETAPTELVAAFPSLIPTAHKGIGIGQSLCRFNSGGSGSPEFRAMYQQGEPDLGIMARFSRQYDPREGSHDIDDETTYQWTEDSVLIGAWFLQQLPTPPDFAIDWTDIGIQATNNDNNYGYKLAGVVPLENKRREIMRDVLESGGCEIYTTENGYSVRIIEDEPTVEFEFEQKHIVEIRRNNGPQGVDRPNTAVLSYYRYDNPDQNGELNLLSATWANQYTEIDRYGESLHEIDLSLCPDHLQAQRIGRRLFAEKRTKRGVLVTNQVGAMAIGRKVIAFRDNKANQRVIARVKRVRELRGEGKYEIHYEEVPVLKDWSSETKVDAPQDTTQLSSGIYGAAPAAPTQAILVAGQMRLAGIASYTETEMTFRTYNSQDNYSIPQYLARTGTGTGSERWYWPGVAGKTSFRQRGRANPSNNEYSPWSPYLTVTLAADNTAPETPTALFDPINIEATTYEITFTVSTPLELNLDEIQYEWEYTSSSSATAPLANTITKTLTLPFAHTHDGSFGRSSGGGSQWVHMRVRTLTENGTASSWSSIISQEVLEQ